MGTIYTAKTMRSYSEKAYWDTHLALCTSEGYVKDLGGKIKLFENEIIFVALSSAYWRVGWDRNREKEELSKAKITELGVSRIHYLNGGGGRK